MAGFHGDQFHPRYERNLLLAGVGEEGQRRLLQANVFVIGVGGLGGAVLPYLAAAGIGRLGVADNDAVEESNLNRQVLYRTSDLGKGKALFAAETLQNLNPDCRVQAVAERITAENIEEDIAGYDLVVDCSDNFATKFLVSDFCWLEKIPLVTAGVVALSGQVMAVVPGEGNPCYRCLLPQEPPTGSTPESTTDGILGAAAGVLGAIQAVETIKILLGIGENLARRLLVYNGPSAEFRAYDRSRNPKCPLCGTSPTITKIEN